MSRTDFDVSSVRSRGCRQVRSRPSRHAADARGGIAQAAACDGAVSVEDASHFLDANEKNRGKRESHVTCARVMDKSPGDEKENVAL